MNRCKFLTKLQTLFGVTRGELFLVIILLGGLVIGSGVKYFSSEDKVKYEQSKDIYKILDSLAEAYKTTYTGSDMQGNPRPELAKGDTVVKSDKSYSNSEKKEITKDKININNATAADLVKLPGIGVKTAQTIIEYRKIRGFKKPEDIMNIKGIGQKKFDRIKDFILVN